jgi:hypothetical protein
MDKTGFLLVNKNRKVGDLQVLITFIQSSEKQFIICQKRKQKISLKWTVFCLGLFIFGDRLNIQINLVLQTR